MTRAGRGLVALCAIVGIAVPAWADDGADLFRHEAARVSMGSTFALVIYGPDEGRLPGIANRALDEVDRIDHLMSDYKPQSPLSLLNREGALRAVPLDAELYDFLKRSVAYSRDSRGAFDVTVGPLMKAWGPFRPHEGHVPTAAQRREALGRVGFDKIIFDDAARTVRFARPGMSLDLGGIAKGYAVDRAVAVLRRQGIARALVTSGGSSAYALGRPPGQQAWELKVADPFSSNTRGPSVRTFALVDRALSVAGISQQSFKAGGATYGHILDPRSGWPVQGIASLVVTSPNATEADALDTVLFVLGVRASRDYLAQHPGSEATFFVGANKTHLTTVTVPAALTTRTEENP